MFADIYHQAPDVDFETVRVISELVEKKFQRLNRPLFHTLRIASNNDPMRNLSRTLLTCYVPSVWGVRRDNYYRQSPETTGGGDVAAFRSAAAKAASFLLSRPIGIWHDLLPGGMKDVMGKRSKLYLPDYWVLILHHLVWSKKLPYPINARWVRGESIHDDTFYFVSELPVDLIEASQDALILFQEKAMETLTWHGVLGEGGDECEPVLLPSEPPLCRDGRWRLITRARTEPSESARGKDDEKKADGKAPLDLDLLALDDQTFAVRYGKRSCRFIGRNKQLFSLLERISRRPGSRIMFDDLRAKNDVWDGSPVEDSTIRSAVTRLRKTLRSHDLIELAEYITTGTYRGVRYVMLQAERKSSL